jgi:hypothetical protein
LTTGTVLQPEQGQYPVGVPQTGLNLFGLKRPITRTKITVEQLRNLFGGTRLFDLVERSKQVLFKAAARIACISSDRAGM